MPLTREKMINYAMKRKNTKGRSVLEEDCDILEYLLDNCTIEIPEENRFFVSVNTCGIQDSVYYSRGDKYNYLIAENGLSNGFVSMAYTGGYDFSHTSAEWKSVIRLGIFGLRNRICRYSDKISDIEKLNFYNNVLKVYNAALRFIARAADEAEKVKKYEMATGLKNLSEGSPKTLFEAMQTVIIYYVLQQMFEGTYLRTLGRLDSLLYPYYKMEDKNNADIMLVDFLKEIDRLEAPSNIPFAIGGTDINGNSLVNKLSFALVDAYDKAETNNTKFHILCSENMPESVVKMCLDCVRRGNNSIVFMSDKIIIESLLKLGAELSDATDYHVVGCYECGANGELTCSCSARVNIPKALECALNGGKDILTGKLIGVENSGEFNSFSELYEEFERQLVNFCKCAMRATDLWEEHYNEIHSAPILSGTYESALENGGDLYCDYSAKYNNSSVNAIGLGTAVDSLVAIRKAVFEDKLLSMKELLDILKSNWKDKEPLRLFIKNKYPKFGQDNSEVDILARNIVKRLSATVNKKPNKKGGVYRLGLFSINWRWEMGEHTAASADGRLSGETLSQNTSATFGAAKNGSTSHLKSVTAIDASDTPNGTIVDIDLHSSAVDGENGLMAMLAALKTYFQLGGFAVHYNVLNTEVLLEAKKHPEKYPDLQVRLCGWNVLFSTLSEKEKDEFIARSGK